MTDVYLKIKKMQDDTQKTIFPRPIIKLTSVYLHSSCYTPVHRGATLYVLV